MSFCLIYPICKRVVLLKNFFETIFISCLYNIKKMYRKNYLIYTYVFIFPFFRIYLFIYLSRFLSRYIIIKRSKCENRKNYINFYINKIANYVVSIKLIAIFNRIYNVISSHLNSLNVLRFYTIKKKHSSLRKHSLYRKKV